MKPYQINELERLTGIKAHTIRIWEKRYNLISPSRTEANRRSYSDDEVRKLLNVSTLLSYGYKISRVAALSDEEINEHIKSRLEHQTTPAGYIVFINQLLDCILVYDERKFEEIFMSLVRELGFYETMRQIIYPFLSRVGILWSTGETEVSREHFATNLVRRKLMAATDSLPKATEKSKKFLLFLPEGEWHDTGLLFANYMIRARGFESYFLGQNLPVKSLKDVIGVVEPQYLLLFYVTNRPAAEIKNELAGLADSYRRLDILVSGNKELLASEETRFRNVTYLSGPEDLIPYLK